MSPQDDIPAGGASCTALARLLAELEAKGYGAGGPSYSTTPELIQGSGLSSGAAPSTADDTPQDFGQGGYSPLTRSDEDMGFPDNWEARTGADIGTSEQNSQFINGEGSVGAVGTPDQAPLPMGGPVGAAIGTFEQNPGMGPGDFVDLSAHFVPAMGTAGSTTGFQAPAPGAIIDPALVSQDYQGDVTFGAGSTAGYQAPPPETTVHPAQLFLNYEGNGMGSAGMPSFGQEMPPTGFATAPVAPNGIQQPALAGADGSNMFDNMFMPYYGGAVQPAPLPGYQQYPVAGAVGNSTNAPAPQEMPAAQSRAVRQRLVARRARRADRAPARGQSTEGEPAAQRPANRVGQQSGWPQARKHHIRNCADVTACNADCLLKEKFPVTHAKWMSSQFQVQVAGEEAPRSISGMELLSRKGEEGLKCFGEVQPDGSINTHSKEPKRDPSEALQ